MARMNRKALLIKRFISHNIVPTFKALVAGAFIALGTYASRVCPYPILAPLLFAVGILMVMVFNAELITRRIPTAGVMGNELGCAICVLLGNLLSAWLLGFLADLPAPQMDLLPLFGKAIIGGAMIGLVSVNNLQDTPYKVPVALLLMYIFVMTGMPHAVVYAFLHSDPLTLLVCIAGNVVGGLLLRGIFKMPRWLSEKF